MTVNNDVTTAGNNGVATIGNNGVAMNSYKRTLALVKRGILNSFTGRPYCVSFEITHNCNAKCRHCHRRGIVEEPRATPQRFAEVYRELKSPVIQISGGEPLTRKDVEDIIQAVKQPDGTPYIVFVTNAALLTEKKYYRLREIGVDVFSISFDYPDQRHDEFRSIPGLFDHIKDLIAGIDSGIDKAITLNSVVQRDNFREMLAMSELALSWGVNINFSPYTWLRTNDKGYMIPPNEIPEFEVIIKELLAFKRNYDTVSTTDSFFYDMVNFFKNESIPGCRAGERFLVVNPDATLSPCGLITTDYEEWQALKDGFSAHNTCSFCHTCIRASTEKPLNNLFRGTLKSLISK